MRWTITEADRDEQGRIWVERPARTLADLLPEAPKPEGEETPPPRTPWRPSKMEIAGIVGGLVTTLAAIAALNAFSPAPAPRRTATAAPAATRTATATPTQAPTATLAPTWTPEPPTAVPPTPEPPTPQVVYIEVPPACDPLTNPRFVVELDLSPIGKVRGVSCASQEEASANAEQLAAHMRAAAEGR